MSRFDFSSLSQANPQAGLCAADIRLDNTHFKVAEQLPFEPDGEGGHVMLLIEKNDTNTDWVAKQLARFAGVEDVAVGYAGMKDRHAVTTQWFSVKMEGHVEPDWQQFNHQNWQIKTLSRHKKKLKRGVLSGNHFTLVLSHLKGERPHWQQNLEWIAKFGVPNYFAEQRFGFQHANLDKVDAWFNGGRSPKKRQQRSIYISAARSWLFNLVLAERIKQQNWNQLVTGDVMQLAGTRASFFSAENGDIELPARLAEFDIHPTGPLWGRGQPLTTQDCLLLELQVLADWQLWCQGLEKVGLEQERRALRLHPQALQWQFSDDQLELQFFLPAGSYATAVLRELAIINDASERNSVGLSSFTQVND